MQSNNKTEREQIGRRLQAARTSAHISIQDAAQALDVQPLAIERWERGAALPSLVEFKWVLELYGVMACDVLFDVNPYLLSPEHSAELTHEARTFTPSLRSRIDSLVAMLARGREPEWRKVA